MVVVALSFWCIQYSYYLVAYTPSLAQAKSLLSLSICFTCMQSSMASGGSAEQLTLQCSVNLASHRLQL